MYPSYLNLILVIPIYFSICAPRLAAGFMCPSKVEPLVPGWVAIHPSGLAGSCGHQHDRSHCGPLIKNAFELGARGSPFHSTTASPCSAQDIGVVEFFAGCKSICRGFRLASTRIGWYVGSLTALGSYDTNGPKLKGLFTWYMFCTLISHKTHSKSPSVSSTGHWAILRPLSRSRTGLSLKTSCQGLVSGLHLCCLEHVFKISCCWLHGVVLSKT